MNRSQPADHPSPPQPIDPALRAQWLDAMFNAVDDAVLLTDMDRRIVMANPATRAVFGYEPDEMIGRPTSVIYADSSEYEQIGRSLPAIRSATHAQRLRTHCVRADGSTFEADLTLTAMRDRNGAAVGLLGIVRDVSQQVQSEAERQCYTQRLALMNGIVTGLRIGSDPARVIGTALDSLMAFFPDLRVGYAELDEEGELRFTQTRHPEAMPETKGVAVSLAEAPRLLKDIRTRHLVTINDVAADTRVQPMAHVLEGYGVAATLIAPIQLRRSVVAFLCLDSPDPRQWSEHEMRTLREVGDYLGIAIKDAEVEAARRHTEHELRAREQQLRRQAYHDGLTGLPNRAMFRQRLSQAIERTRNDSAYHFAVFFIDFDRFKFVNDSLGHDAGDALLQGVTQRLREQMRGWSTRFSVGDDHLAARIGGDEFLILVDGLGHDRSAIDVAESLLEALAPPHQLNGQSVVSTASIGVVIHDGRYERAGQIIRDADIAMYRAKAAGRSRYALFDETMRSEVLQRTRLERDLRDAIAGRRLRVNYQPIVNLSSGRVCAFEALVRWPHPEMGMVPPHRFLPLVDELNLGCELGQFVIDEAVGTLAALRRDAGPDSEPTVMHINAFQRQLVRGDMAGQVEAALRNAGLPASALTFEVDEATLVNSPEAVRETLDRLHEIGVRLTMDQFGSGSPCLAHLHRLPVDVLKISPAFVTNLEGQPQYAAVIQAIITLAHSLDMQVIGEGVESESQLAQLQALDCDMGQGFFLSGPLSAEQTRRCLDHCAFGCRCRSA